MLPIIRFPLSRGVARVADLDNQGCHHLLCAPGPLPSYAADTAGPQLHHVPVLRVSHVEEEGEADNPWGLDRLSTNRYLHQGTLHIHEVYTRDTHTLHRGETGAIYSVPEPAGTFSQPTPLCL